MRLCFFKMSEQRESFSVICASYPTHESDLFECVAATNCAEKMEAFYVL